MTGEVSQRLKSTRSGEQQLKTFLALIEGKEFGQDSPILGAAVGWLKNCPVPLNEKERERLCVAISHAFKLTRDELAKKIYDAPIEQFYIEPEKKDAMKIEEELLALLPASGFFRDYANYTKHSEAPLAYHVFCSLMLVGLVLNRRIKFDMGYFQVFPPLGLAILGPSGIKKTTSADVAVSLITEMGITKIYSEKLTPEALVEAMRDCAQGLVYAPEAKVLLGNQNYMEGLIPLLTRFMDCPESWASETVSRGLAPLTNIALSVTFCSTEDWFVRNVPEDMFGGGFIARLLLVIQQESPRRVAIPKVSSINTRRALMGALAQMHTQQGTMYFTPELEEYYEQWYNHHKDITKEPDHELMMTYYQRKPLHVIRIAMILHVADHRDMKICQECLDRAIKLLDWNERFMPLLLKEMFKTQSGMEAQFILKLIKSNGGIIDHSALVRRVQYRMNAGALRTILNSLKEAKQVEEKVDPIHAWVVR